MKLFKKLSVFLELISASISMIIPYSKLSFTAKETYYVCQAAALRGSDHRRATTVSARLDAQQKKLNLPALPTTTIGSFPQTVELRRVRREYKAKK